MKATTLAVSFLIAVFTSASFAAEEITLLLQNEMKRAKENIQLELDTARKKLDGLKASRENSEKAAKKLAETEKVGVELLKSYIVLLNARYVNAKGEYSPGYEVNEKDQEYINRLFGKYLRSHPLQGRTSTGEATRVINWGIARLNDLIKIHSNPTVSNNSDLELLANQMKELESSIARNGEVAKKLGLDPSRGGSAGDKEPARGTASSDDDNNFEDEE